MNYELHDPQRIQTFCLKTHLQSRRTSAATPHCDKPLLPNFCHHTLLIVTRVRARVRQMRSMFIRPCSTCHRGTREDATKQEMKGSSQNADFEGRADWSRELWNAMLQCLRPKHATAENNGRQMACAKARDSSVRLARNEKRYNAMCPRRYSTAYHATVVAATCQSNPHHARRVLDVGGPHEMRVRSSGSRSVAHLPLFALRLCYH